MKANQIYTIPLQLGDRYAGGRWFRGGVTSYTFTNIAEAILQGHSTTFIAAFDLTSKIQKSLTPAAKIDYYSRVKVLCIDELGYTYQKKEDTDILFQIISKRSENAAHSCIH